jgi:NTP pyrophosphatase (non-canonical NTP hydrolase)
MARVPQFRNAKGELAHKIGSNDHWTLADWMNATMGELGEAANILKKVRRGDLTMAEAHLALSKELADVMIYLDILACVAGVNLGDAVVDKFNEVSERVGATIYIDGRCDSWYVTKGNEND